MTTVRCAPCGWTGAFADDAEPRIEWCPTCRTGITVPPPQRDVFGDEIWTAEGGYANRLADRDQWHHEAGKRAAWVRKHLPAGTVVEIGAATGEFVAALEREGFTAVGLEASEWAATNSRDITRAVENIDLATWRGQHPGELFDAAAAFHTLEHFDQPRDFVVELRAAIKPGGLLFLEVPNGASRAAQPDGRGWCMSRFHDHVYHYNPVSLTRLLTECGFASVKTSTHPAWLYGWEPAWKRAARIAKARQAPPRDLLRAVALAR